MRAVVIANGDIKDYEYYKQRIKKDDFVICADGAIRHCIELNLTPDLWIGDFDSCNYRYYIDKYPRLSELDTRFLNPQKDETDTHAACNIALEKGCQSIVIWGALGSRFDHSVSNIHLLEYLLKKGISAYIENEKNTLTVFDRVLKVNKARKYLSLIPLDKSVFVEKTEGLKYPLKDFYLSREISRGVSNEILYETAAVTVKDGIMLAIESDD